MQGTEQETYYFVRLSINSLKCLSEILTSSASSSVLLIVVLLEGAAFEGLEDA